MSKEEVSNGFALGKQNLIIILVAFLIIVIGFFLMSGGGSDDLNKFSEELFSPTRITVAPILVMLGFILVVVGIVRKPKD